MRWATYDGKRRVDAAVTIQARDTEYRRTIIVIGEDTTDDDMTVRLNCDVGHNWGLWSNVQSARVKGRVKTAIRVEPDYHLGIRERAVGESSCSINTNENSAIRLQGQ